ncbi:hypothetical protein HDV00_004155 [Rhizophlyctis rosea]|nr:hypothetical protein HDV00_004155 [Rhizophlyctis rosea]
MANSKFKFQWQPWARIQALGAGLFILTAGVIGLFFAFPIRYWGLGNIGLGLLILAFEYPIPPLNKLGPLSKSLWFRTVFHLAACAETTFFAPATTGGLCLLCAALTYLKAAFNGEQFAGSGGARPRDRPRATAGAGGGSGGGGGKGGSR